MIITKTPFRVSFVGGGSDFEEFYRIEKGAVVSSSINQYMYIFLHNKFDKKIKLNYSEIENVDNVELIKHPLIRNCLNYFHIKNDIEISSIADIPKGTGLGSSSAFTVGLINALSFLSRTSLSKEDIARISCDIEINKCHEPIGKQDQYATCFGGLNLIEFNSNNTVSVTNLEFTKDFLDNFNDHLLFFYTGHSRSAASVLSQQKINITKYEIYSKLKELVSFVYDFISELKSFNVDMLGKILNDSWKIKKELSVNVSNSFIDDCYNRAIANGAIGGKLLGAGNGGFLMFLVSPKNHQKVSFALKDLNSYNFKFDDLGTTKCWSSYE